jgi:hypothetical protein
MRLLLGLLAYLVAVVAVGGGAAAVLLSIPEPGAGKATARQETPVIGPRIQAWLERKAEGVAFAEREKAAALAERERTEALRAKLASVPEPALVTRASADEERQAAERERAARAKEGARREARRRIRELEAQTAFGYAPEPRRPAYPDEFLTRRDRYGY